MPLAAKLRIIASSVAQRMPSRIPTSARSAAMRFFYGAGERTLFKLVHQLSKALFVVAAVRDAPEVERVAKHVRKAMAAHRESVLLEQCRDRVRRRFLSGERQPRDADHKLHAFMLQCEHTTCNFLMLTPTRSSARTMRTGAR